MKTKLDTKKAGIILALNLSDSTRELQVLENEGITDAILLLGRYNGKLERSYFVPYKDAERLDTILKLAELTEQHSILYCGSNGVRIANRTNRFYVDEFTPYYKWLAHDTELLSHIDYTLCINSLTRYVLVDSKGEPV